MAVLNRRGVSLWFAVAVLATVVVLFAPRPSGEVADHVHKEDGEIFLAQAVSADGPTLTEPYTGYQHWSPRVIATGCSALEAGQFARCATWSSDLFRVGLALATFFLLGPVLPRRGWAALAASMFVLVPMGQQEVLGNLTNLRWFADAFGVVALSVRATRWRVAAPVAAIAALCALTDPLALLIAPLALWHIWKPPNRATLLIPFTYAGAALLHWSLLDSGARTADIAGVFSRVGETSEQLLVRGPMVAQFGQNGSEGLLLVLGLPLALLAVLLPAGVLALGLGRLPRAVRAMVLVWVAWSLGLLLVTISFADSNDIALTEYWRIGQASRYSVVPGVLVGMALVVSACALFREARWPGRVLARVAFVALVAAIALDWPGDGYNVQGPQWSDTVRDAARSCDQGLDVVTVTLTPTGVPTAWEADLPCSWIQAD